MNSLIRTKNIKNKLSKPNISIGNENILGYYYETYFDSLTSKELDKEFSKDLKYISKILKELPEKNRQKYIGMLSNIIEFYISQKINKRLDDTFEKFLQLNG